MIDGQVKRTDDTGQRIRTYGTPCLRRAGGEVKRDDSEGSEQECSRQVYRGDVLAPAADSDDCRAGVQRGEVSPQLPGQHPGAEVHGL